MLLALLLICGLTSIYIESNCSRLVRGSCGTPAGFLVGPLLMGSLLMGLLLMGLLSVRALTGLGLSWGLLILLLPAAYSRSIPSILPRLYSQVLRCMHVVTKGLLLKVTILNVGSHTYPRGVRLLGCQVIRSMLCCCFDKYVLRVRT